MKKRAGKILVAMSGGVDSSVAAALLARAGYDVTGAFMIQQDNTDTPMYANDADHADVNDSCWLSEYRDALRVAAHLGIPLLKLDFTKEYERLVLEYMFSEYRKGRTPNPDVLCNTYVKFGVWLDWALKNGFDNLATGHYASIKTLQHKSIKAVNLIQAKDRNKDQTYFLHQLNQEQLSHVIFPIGHLLKSEVRSLAHKFGLPTAEKEESMGICFVGEVPMKEFLAKKIKMKPGNIVTTAGDDLGKHDGLPFYTIGQRHFGLKNRELRIKNQESKPLYIVEKRFLKNELVVGYADDSTLYKKEIVVNDLHWIAGRAPEFPLHCEVRLRHRQPLQHCRIMNNELGITVEFAAPQRAVTPGQFAVFYLPRRSGKAAKAGKDGECLGGGVIK